MLARVLLLAIPIFVAPAAAQAPPQQGQIDLNVFKCSEFLKSDLETSKRIVFWLAGYFTYEDDPTIIGVAKLTSKEQQLRQYCADNGDLPIIDASAIFLDRKYTADVSR